MRSDSFARALGACSMKRRKVDSSDARVSGVRREGKEEREEKRGKRRRVRVFAVLDGGGARGS